MMSRSEVRCMQRVSVRGGEGLGLLGRHGHAIDGQRAGSRLGDQHLEAGVGVRKPLPDQRATGKRWIELESRRADFSTDTMGCPPHSSETGWLAPRTTTTSVSQTWLAHRLPGLRSTNPAFSRRLPSVGLSAPWPAGQLEPVGPFRYTILVAAGR